MRSAKHQTQFAVRRVIVSESGYVCGMCRNHYETHAEAVRCLRICVKEQILAITVERVRHFGQLRYRCSICRRMHQELANADTCIAACKSKLIDQASLDELDGLEAKMTVAGRKKYVAQPKPQKVKLIPPYRIRRMINDAEVDKEIDEATKAQEEQNAAQSGEKPKKEPITKRKADLKDKFVRQGAEYQCAFCLKLYYTKVEVMACFEAHPDEEIIDPGD